MKHRKEEESISFAKAHAAMHVCLAGVATELKVDQGFPEVMPLLKSGGRYLLPGEWCLVPTLHDYKYEQNRNPRYFLLITGPEAITIWTLHSWHWYVDYPMKQKKKLGKVLKMEEAGMRSLYVCGKWVCAACWCRM